MPRGRFLSREISWDEKVATLSDDTARLLFTWMIPHLDREGRIQGNPNLFKAKVVPTLQISERRIEKYLDEMEKLCLIFRYTVNGFTYLSVPNFLKHQKGLKLDREAPSVIPPPNTQPTQDTLPSNSGVTPPQVQVEVQVKDKVQVEGEDYNYLLKEIIKLEGWGVNQLKEDDRWLVEFLSDHPKFNEGHIKACRDYHSGKTNNTKAAWKTRLRNWIMKDREIKKQGGDDGDWHRR